ncbi:hypothetical protein GCM10010250_65670 [Streptomyces althioticus]|nr:hypothetical protein GCM10010250_65670 [Streptomyces althioticus]
MSPPKRHGLDPFQRVVGEGRRLHLDGIVGADGPSTADHSRDATLEDELAGQGVHGEDRAKQPLAEVVDLRAQVAQSCHLEHRLLPEMEQSAGGQAQQVHPARGDVLAKLARGNLEALEREFVEEFLVHQVDLAQIGQVRLVGHAELVADRLTCVNVSLHAEPREQRDGIAIGLAERVRLVTAHCGDLTRHHALHVLSFCGRSIIEVVQPEACSERNSSGGCVRSGTIPS